MAWYIILFFITYFACPVIELIIVWIWRSKFFVEHSIHTTHLGLGFYFFYLFFIYTFFFICLINDGELAEDDIRLLSVDSALFFIFCSFLSLSYFCCCVYIDGDYLVKKTLFCKKRLLVRNELITYDTCGLPGHATFVIISPNGKQKIKIKMDTTDEKLFKQIIAKCFEMSSQDEEKYPYYC